MQMTAKREYPSVAHLRRPDYRASGSEPGFDGNPPRQEPARDIDAIDRLTGRRIRETPKGEENVNSTRVRALHFRKRLTDRQFYAAEMYANTHELALMQPVSSAVPIRVDCGHARSTLPDEILDAQARDAEARAALAAASQDGRHVAIVELVVLKNLLLEVAAAMLKIHHQRASERLETGLDALADHYGIGE